MIYFIYLFDVETNDTLITEQVAIYIYLADLFQQAGLAPPIGDPQRGPYLRWLVFYGTCFEPAMMDRALKREPGRPMAMPTATLKRCSLRSPNSSRPVLILSASVSQPPICCGVRR
jgi:hypothetical protein